MNKVIKIGLICMAIGAVLIAGVGVIHGFDFRVLAETVAQKKTFEISEAFDQIAIGSDSGTIYAAGFGVLGGYLPDAESLAEAVCYGL